jgi:O-antigen/teichoic acid export membrane protein
MKKAACVYAANPDSLFRRRPDSERFRDYLLYGGIGLDLPSQKNGDFEQIVRKILSAPVSNMRRIANNTLMLYFRQILIMLVSLYTVRAVLETLGAEDYGIYNVVAGVVTMFGFLSGSMATASQRFFAFELGRGDFERLKRIFSLSLLIYALIALIVLFLAETAGLWFVSHKLIIPPERRGAARWIYQFSIVSFVFTIMVSPFIAAIIAHEDMNIYAAVSIVEAALKLGIVLLLKIIPLDKLELYGILLCAVTAINTGIYSTICKLRYQECKFRFYRNKELFKELAGFTGWNLFGAASYILRTQGINILLNLFFGPLVNAARGIAVQVNSVVNTFSQNFITAIRPQITKQYAGENYPEMLNLVFWGSKLSYFLMFIFTVPVLFETPYIIKIWLINPPPYVVVFICLGFLNTLFESISYPLTYVAQATGRIRLYQSIVAGILLLNIPFSYLALKMGFPPYSVMFVGVSLTIVTFFVRILMIKRLLAFFLIRAFIKQVLIPVFSVSILSIIFPFFIVNILSESFFRLCVSFVSIIVTIFCIYYIGLTKTEQMTVQRYFKNTLARFLK